MKILTIGDIVGRTGRDAVIYYLDKYKDRYDIIIANGENISHGNGMSTSAYNEMIKHGIDGFTMGNHTWGNRDIDMIMKYNSNVVRPANFSRVCPGHGSMVLKTSKGIRVGVTNVIGRIYMPVPYDSPFDAVEREIAFLKDKADIILVDFHAEATSEKLSMGYFLDGRVSAVFGTHTHVQTADETILPGGSGYITDIGMTGAFYSVLGMDKNIVLNKFLDGMPAKFEIATGKSRFCGCEFEIDENTGKTVNIKRVAEIF